MKPLFFGSSGRHHCNCHRRQLDVGSENGEFTKGSFDAPSIQTFSSVRVDPAFPYQSCGSWLAADSSDRIMCTLYVRLSPNVSLLCNTTHNGMKVWGEGLFDSLTYSASLFIESCRFDGILHAWRSQSPSLRMLLLHGHLLGI